jgi:hypothetical protein
VDGVDLQHAHARDRIDKILRSSPTLRGLQEILGMQLEATGLVQAKRWPADVGFRSRGSLRRH